MQEHLPGLEEVGSPEGTWIQWTSRENQEKAQAECTRGGRKEQKTAKIRESCNCYYRAGKLLTDDPEATGSFMRTYFRKPTPPADRISIAYSI